MKATYDRDPVGLILGSYNKDFGRWVDEHPSSVVAPGVAVVVGPALHEALPAVTSPVAAYPSVKLGLLGVATLVILSLVGMGWAIVLLGTWLDRVEVMSLAPAVGIAVVVLSGIAVDRLGIRLSGLGPGALALAIPLAAGWGAVLWRRKRGPGGDDGGAVSRRS
jgi:hypothetical protein